MSICKDCIHYEICDEYVSPCESFPEVDGCKCFKNKADVVEVKHGYWIHSTKEVGVNLYHRWQCSECGRTVARLNESDIEDLPYCHCGAKMDGERREYGKGT